jgi:long-chain acyl-CoA synthetase
MGILMLSPAAAQGAGNPLSRRELEASFEAHLRHVNEGLDPHEQLDCLVTVSEPWTVDNGFITPTFKVKRNRIEEAYGTLFEGWSRAGRAVLWHAG